MTQLRLGSGKILLHLLFGAPLDDAPGVVVTPDERTPERLGLLERGVRRNGRHVGIASDVEQGVADYVSRNLAPRPSSAQPTTAATHVDTGGVELGAHSHRFGAPWRAERRNRGHSVQSARRHSLADRRKRITSRPQGRQAKVME